MSAVVKLTRRVAFSSGHRYWLSSLDEAENKALFGEWASPYNHGHNYILDVSVEGEVEEATGMVVNIKRIDDVLQARVVRVFDGKSINDQVPAFAAKAPSLENLLTFFKEDLTDNLPHECRLTGLRLEEMPTLWGEFEDRDGWKMNLTRTYEFAASHRLHSEALTDAENLEIFGKCNNPAGHGHNYVLEVTVEGSPDPKTGMLYDLGQLDQIVEENVVNRYDHKNLNVDLPEFAGKNTTSEVVALQIFETLQGALKGLHRVRLHETARNIFEVSA